MTTYSDYSDPTEYSETLEASCCSSSPEVADVEEPYSSDWIPAEDVLAGDDWSTEHFGGTYEVVAPASYEPAAGHVDSSMVIPAGQPGGYEVVAAPSVDWQTSGSAVDDLYPAAGTIGGNPFGAITITPGDAAAPTFGHDLGTIGGGNPYGAITITMGGDTPYVSATSATIGQTHPSDLDVLGSLYGKAADSGDIFSQATMMRTIHATQAVTAPYTAPIL